VQVQAEEAGPSLEEAVEDEREVRVPHADPAGIAREGRDLESGGGEVAVQLGGPLRQPDVSEEEAGRRKGEEDRDVPRDRPLRAAAFGRLSPVGPESDQEKENPAGQRSRTAAPSPERPKSNARRARTPGPDPRWRPGKESRAARGPASAPSGSAVSAARTIASSRKRTPAKKPGPE